MKRILIGTIAVMMSMPVMAEDTPATGDKTTTSKPYVDTQIETTQLKIPAANTAGVGPGDSVITYTNVAGGGVIGERELFTGGVYNASTDADKMITASALNNTFTNLPTTDTTTLECANPGTCTLWIIIDQTAYGVSGNGTTTIDLSQLVNTNGTGYCYKRLSDGTVNAGTCTTAPSNHGDWGAVFPYNDGTVQVSGISACSTLSGSVVGRVASNQSQVQSDYESNMLNALTGSPVGGYCYCKVTNPSTSAAGWVFWLSASVSFCAIVCAARCADYVRDVSDLRGAVFGAN